MPWLLLPCIDRKGSSNRFESCYGISWQYIHSFRLSKTSRNICISRLIKVPKYPQLQYIPPGKPRSFCMTWNRGSGIPCWMWRNRSTFCTGKPASRRGEKCFSRFLLDFCHCSCMVMKSYYEDGKDTVVHAYPTNALQVELMYFHFPAIFELQIGDRFW